MQNFKMLSFADNNTSINYKRT